MFWIALLILLVFIAFLLVRESKRRAEWQLEYRYLSRHEAHTEKKNAAAQPVDAFTHGENVAETSRFDADYDVTGLISEEIKDQDIKDGSYYVYVYKAPLNKSWE